MNEKNSPSIARILQVDYLARLAALFLLIILGVTILMQVLQAMAGSSDESGSFWPLALANALMALLLMGFRIYAVTTVFNNGVATPGVIVTVTTLRDRTRIEFAYTWVGESLVREVEVAKDARAAALATGQNVTVLVDRGEPRRILIRELYV